MPVSVRALINDEVVKRGSIKAVAETMGISRTAVSLYLSERYEEIGGRIDRFEEKALAVFSDRVNCPHLKTDLSSEDCRSYASGAMPQSDPQALKHWFACRNCPLNTTQDCRKEGAA
jgi:hypothetical protein